MCCTLSWGLGSALLLSSNSTAPSLPLTAANINADEPSCKKVVEGGDDEREGFLPMLNAIADYEMFISLMLETKEKMASA